MKKFDEWNNFKKEINDRDSKNLYVKERQIWWCSIGVNIGHEIDGKNNLFERPVIILKKVTRNTVLILPLSTKEGSEYYYEKIEGLTNLNYGVFNQIKIIDIKRLDRKIQTLNKVEFERLYSLYEEKYRSRLAAASSDPEGLYKSSIADTNILSNQNMVIYNKLVRDKMTDIWDADKIKGDVYNTVSFKYIDKKEILEKLKDKISEETKEVMEAYDKEDKSHLKEEIGDLIEVIDAILYHNNISLDEVLKMRNKKKDIRGGFEKGLFLEWIDYKDGQIR